MEVILVAVPTIVILRDVSTDGRYLGLIFLVLAFPMSALGFIMVPKVSAYYEAVNSRTASRRGGAKGSVFVSGLNGSPYVTDSSKTAGARLGSDNRITETPTPQVSTGLVETHSSSEVPTTELPRAQEGPPLSSTSLGSNIEVPPTELPQAQEGPPLSSTSLGSNNAIVEPSASSL
jgi:hypothetical protein